MSLLGTDVNLKGSLGFKGETGYSAYEIAVLHGFIGTEQDWLSTLGTSSHFTEDSVIHTSTAGQTVFALPSQYTSNSFIDVYVNGLRLTSQEYTLNTQAKTITLTNGLGAGADVEIVVLTMSTNSLPIVTNINSSSTDETAPSTKTVYKNLDIYCDDITVEKFRDNTSNTDYYISKIPNTYRFKLGIANDDTDLNTLESTLDFAHRKKATFCINAGIYNIADDSPIGVLIQDGVVLQDETYNNDNAKVLGIKENGSFEYYAAKTTSATTMINQGVKTAVLGFFPIITNGSALSISETAVHPRQILARKSDGTYIVLTCDGRTHYDEGMSYSDVQRILLTYNVTEAYALDGGGSSSTVFKGIKQNKNIDDMIEDRAVSNFLYIVKNNIDTNSINDAFSEIAKLKQELNKKLVELENIESGILKLKGKQGSHFPGVEAYTDGDDTRLGKIGYQDAENLIKCFFATLNVEGTETTVFRANERGIWNKNGLMANFLSYATPIEDCNIKGVPNAIYFSSTSTANNSGTGNCIVLHLNFSAGMQTNIRQIAIPLDENRPIKMRGCNSSGVWGNWYNYGITHASTSYRSQVSPNPSTGTMLFDDTTKKPIWYDGTKWVDATGTAV